MMCSRRVFANALSVLAVAGALLVAACSSPEDRALSYYQRGLELIAKGDDTKARLELRNALKFNNNLIEGWRAIAQLEERGRNWQAYMGAARRIVELDPKDVETRLRIARLLFIGNAMDEALKFIDAAGDINPDHAGVHALRSALLLKIEDASGAVREARRALELDRDNLDAKLALAAERLASRDGEGALRILDNVSGAQKDELSVLFLRVKIFEQMKDLPQIEAHLRKLAELFPQDPVFKTELVRFYAANRRFDDAEKVLRTIAAAAPNDVKAGLDVVRFLNSVKGAEAARVELESLIATGGNKFAYQIALADFQISTNRAAEAVKLLEELTRSGKAEDRLAAKVKLAEVHAGAKNSAAAEAQIADILRDDARNVAALRLRAALRIDRAEFEPAIIDLRQALNDQPRSPELLSLLGFAYERSGLIELADKQFADAMRSSQFAVNTSLRYVEFLMRRGSLGHAENVLLDLAARQPGNVAILSALAQVRLRRQNWIGAQEIAEVIRKIGDRTGVADQIEGAALGGQQKFDQSISALQRAYAARPEAVSPMLSLVQAYIRAQKVDSAESFLNSVLKASADNADALVLLGSTQLVKNAPEEAEKHFKAAIMKQPTRDVGYRALATHYMSTKRQKEAEEIIRTGLAQQPNSSSLRLMLAGIHESKGEFEQAIAVYEKLFEEQPGSMVIANNLASLIADHRSDKASLDRAHTIAGVLAKAQIPHFKDTLGWIQFRRGDYKTAAILLGEAAAELPNVALVHYHLGRTYIALGDEAKGAEHLKKSYDLAPDEDLKKKIRAALESRSERG